MNWVLPSELDRVDQHRSSTEWVGNLWRSEDARLLKIDKDARFTTNETGDQLRMTRPFVEFDSQRHILLGLLDGSPVFVVEALTEGPVHSLREVGHQLTDVERDIASAAAAITNWHRSEPRCGRCGNPSTVINGGFSRYCSADEVQFFPRTDPAVIVAVVDDWDRLLLAGQTNWPNRRVSVLAGFVEAGESMEQAIHREIAEEVDVALSEVRYFGSQPWPFPRSLMVGFAARAKTTEIAVDGHEIEFADWFTRDRVRAELASGELSLPGKASIASRLIDAWLEGQLDL
ncbi:NAD(+) diphosphatase [Microlunatus panaciterrae]|nr:NAD(+) diphosphatase [Microlunatus panaciterrae]